MGVHRYSVYGTVIASDHRFSIGLAPGTGEAALRLSVTVAPAPRGDEPDGWFEIFQGTAQLDDGRPMFRILRKGDEVLIRYAEVADFLLTGSQVLATAYDEDYLRATEIYFLGTVLSVWLELRGCLVLHGAAVAIDGIAAVFLGDKGAGKTTMTCGFLRRGDALIADDLAVIPPGGALVVPSAYPALRLWPAQAEALFGPVDLDPVLPGETKCWAPLPPGGVASGFSGQGAPLAAFYELKRFEGPGDTVFERLGPAESVLCLIRNSFVPNVARALGLAPPRLTRCSEIVGAVPLFAVRYGGTLEGLARVSDEIARHTHGLRPPKASPSPATGH